MNILFTTYYQEQNKQRESELDLCLELNESSFDEVVVLAENVPCPPYSEFEGIWVDYLRRPTYRDVFELTSRLKKTDVVVVSNCDIVIPLAALKQISESLKANQVYCLTRWEQSKQGTYLRDVFYSQDVWCIRGPVKKKVPGDFYFGVPGCDNRISFEFQEAGYTVLNPSKSIRTYHFHSSEVRTVTNKESSRVPPSYLYVSPHLLEEPPVTRRADTMEQRKQEFRRKGRR